jgi:hypothetical protein
MLFLSSVIRVLLVLFVVRLVLRGIAALFRARPAAPAPAAPARQFTSELIRDRVCNTFLPRDRALLAVVAGHEEHFCSAACRDKALAAVSRAS